ncbi:MAG: alpha/beta fold hydrolase [Acidobacteria bacterium]|nr:alpha/beta fold hydrolase [Acidobacteriota bacterium]
MFGAFNMTHSRKSGNAPLGDGASLRYTLHGEDRPELPKLVLVHSLGMSEVVWDEVVERLVERTAILTYDCRGHGASTKLLGKSPGPYRLEGFARDLAALLDHVGWSSAHIAGGSLGGSIALQFAALFPSRVQTLGLIDTTAWYGAEAPEKWEWRAKEAEEKGLPALIDFQQTRWFSDSFREQHPETVALCRNVFLANETACFVATCRMLGAFDLRAHLAGFHMPVAIAVGEEDYATPPEMARQLESNIAGATMQIIPQARHLTFVEQPALIAEILSRLIDRA